MAIRLLIATVPWRRPAFRRLAMMLAGQTVKPASVHLYLDGYGDSAVTPWPFPLAVHETRTASPAGPGGRWALVGSLDPDDIVVNLDDDVEPPPVLIEALVAKVSEKTAAATMGITPSGALAAPGRPANEPLVCAGGATLAFRAGGLAGLAELAQQVKAAGGGDVLGDCGDDEAIVSACLWKNGVAIEHVNVPWLRFASDAQERSQTKRRLAKGGVFWAQRERIREVTGWPWPKVACGR